jgi:hypothetical protein
MRSDITEGEYSADTEDARRYVEQDSSQITEPEPFDDEASEGVHGLHGRVTRRSVQWACALGLSEMTHCDPVG